MPEPPTRLKELLQWIETRTSTRITEAQPMQPARALPIIIEQDGNVFTFGSLRITLTVEVIDQARAIQDLNNRARNRLLRDAYADALGRDMVTTHFGFTGESIIYDWDGKLLDGQHRLRGVACTGVPIVAVVVRGINPAEFYRIDSGNVRSMADVESIKGVPEPGVYTAALRLLHRHKGGWLGVARFPTATNDELEQTEVTWPGLGRSMTARRWTRGMLPPSVGVFFHFIFAQQDSEAADTFIQKLGSGADLSEGSPIHTLRNLIVRYQQEDRDIPRITLYAWIIKAWNAYRQGRPLTRLTFGANEAFPQLYEGEAVEAKPTKGR